jgi:hypothetical protein
MLLPILQQPISVDNQNDNLPITSMPVEPRSPSPAVDSANTGALSAAIPRVPDHNLLLPQQPRNEDGVVPQVFSETHPPVRRSRRAPRKRKIVLSEDEGAEEGCFVDGCTITGSEPMAVCLGPACNIQVFYLSNVPKTMLNSCFFIGSPVLRWAEDHGRS